MQPHRDRQGGGGLEKKSITRTLHSKPKGAERGRATRTWSNMFGMIKNSLFGNTEETEYKLLSSETKVRGVRTLFTHNFITIITAFVVSPDSAWCALSGLPRLLLRTVTPLYTEKAHRRLFPQIACVSYPALRLYCDDCDVVFPAVTTLVTLANGVAVNCFWPGRMPPVCAPQRGANTARGPPLINKPDVNKQGDAEFCI